MILSNSTSIGIGKKSLDIVILVVKIIWYQKAFVLDSGHDTKGSLLPIPA